MAGNGLDSGDAIRGSDKFRFFRGWNTDQSAGERDVPFTDLVTYLNDPAVLTSVGGVDSSRIDTIENNLAINTLNDVIVEGRTVFNMVDQFSDAFTDETGVNTGSNVNANYIAASDYYTNEASDSATLLISSNTSDGSTTFTDSAASKTVTANGDVQHDTAQAQFGSSSILFDGTGDSLTLADSDDWTLGTGDFTVDLWIRTTSVTGNNTILGQWGGAGSTNAFLLYLAGAEVTLNTIDDDDVTTFNLASSSTPISINTWHHVAVVRSGNDFDIYVDGTSVANGTSSISINAVTSQLNIGGTIGVVTPFEGHMDEIRWLKGTAAWTTNFTPPAGAYAITTGDMTLISNSVTASSAPSYGRIVMLVDPVSAVTLNTDLVVSFSRDGGSTWATATLTYDQDYSANVQILTTGDIDLSATTSGTGIVVRAVTANSKLLQVHGWTVQWR